MVVRYFTRSLVAGETEEENDGDLAVVLRRLGKDAWERVLPLGNRAAGSEEQTRIAGDCSVGSSREMATEQYFFILRETMK